MKFFSNFKHFSNFIQISELKLRSKWLHDNQILKTKIRKKMLKGNVSKSIKHFLLKKEII